MKSLRGLTIAFAVLIALLLMWRLNFPRHSAANSNYGTVADFSFLDQANQPFGLKELKGKFWVADFIFTRCLGPCPVLTTKMAQFQKEFAGKSNLVFVSFSVDPDHDTPAVLTKYAGTYGADSNRWHFLTGSKEKIYKLIRESFHLAVEPAPNQKPSTNDILHSLYFVLIDGEGKIVGYFNTSDENAVNQLREKIRDLL